MTYILEDLVIDRVDLVDEGANSAAHISLFKRKETVMDLKDIIAKLTPEHGAVVQAELDRLSNEVTKATQALNTANDDLAKAKSELDKAKTPEASEEDILKSMPETVRTQYTKMKEQKEAAEAAILKAKEAEVTATAVAKAAELKALPVEHEKLVGILKGCSAELVDVLSTVNEAMNATVLNEVGKNGTSGGSAADAWGKIEAKALEIAKAEGITKAKAISKAVDANPDLYKDYLKGGAN